MNQPLALLPFVPSGPDFDKTRSLFQLLGFHELWEKGDYAGYQWGGAKFILQRFDNKEFASNFMVKLEVPDLDAWWPGFEEAARLAAVQFPGFSYKPPTTFPWGREVNFIDLAGVCWHVGKA